MNSYAKSSGLKPSYADAERGVSPLFPSGRSLCKLIHNDIITRSAVDLHSTFPWQTTPNTWRSVAVDSTLSSAKPMSNNLGNTRSPWFAHFWIGYWTLLSDMSIIFTSQLHRIMLSLRYSWLTFTSMTASMIVDIAYGIQAKPEDDYFIGIADRVLRGHEKSTTMSIIDILPWGTCQSDLPRLSEYSRALTLPL